MKHCLLILCLLSFAGGLSSCNESKQQSPYPLYKKFVSDEGHELFQPIADSKAILILFGGFGETPQHIQQEFPIIPQAIEKQVAVLFIRFNQRLWLENRDKTKLSQQISSIFEKHELPKDSLYIGGFSSGGNIALMLSSFLHKNTQASLKPNGIFIIDSPLDLSELYSAAQKTLHRQFSKTAMLEAEVVSQLLKQGLGNPSKEAKAYEKHSPFTLKSRHISNLSPLKECKIRLYTEPDSNWWKKHREADYEQMNAYPILQLSLCLQENGFKKVEYISTENKGYRSNGMRHPHSWSIVDIPQLLEWVLS